jgi:phage tail-like protein
MSTSVQKSWLLGGGYIWRSYSAFGVDETEKSHALSLTRVAEEPKASAKAAAPIRQFTFGALGYDISREQKEVRAYTVYGQLRHLWGPRDIEGNEVSRSDGSAWDPVEITGDDGCAYILDRAHQMLFLHVYGRETLAVFARSDDPSSRWARVSLDEYGCLLVFDERTRQARCYSRGGEFLGISSAAFPDPVVPAKPQAAPAPAPGDMKTHLESGYLITKPLDSNVYNCQWHRMELRLSHLPAGTQVAVKAFACAAIGDAPVAVKDPRWIEAFTVVAAVQPKPGEVSRLRSETFLIQGGLGQFLTILLEVQGDGFGTPVVESLRVHYPRETYLEYLPPLYSSTEPMRVFLEGFLSIFQSEWDEFDRRVEESEALFDPRAVPAGTAMKYLAGWLALQLEDTWCADQNRQLLEATPKILSIRGTLEALRRHVAVYLANFSGLQTADIEASAFPGIIEGFRERTSLLLNDTTGATLGDAKPLWSDAVVRRLQLGGFSQVGEAALVSTGNPERDAFDYFAHRFRLYVPAAWIRTKEQERLLRNAIASQIPAHVKYELCLVQPGLRVDIQSTVGLDTILGDAPSWLLPDDMEKKAPGVRPLNTLGGGAVLAGAAGLRSVVVDSTTVVGDWTLD